MQPIWHMERTNPSNTNLDIRVKTSRLDWSNEEADLVALPPKPDVQGNALIQQGGIAAQPQPPARFNTFNEFAQAFTAKPMPLTDSMLHRWVGHLATQALGSNPLVMPIWNVLQRSPNAWPKLLVMGLVR